MKVFWYMLEALICIDKPTDFPLGKELTITQGASRVLCEYKVPQPHGWFSSLSNSPMSLNLCVLLCYAANVIVNNFSSVDAAMCIHNQQKIYIYIHIHIFTQRRANYCMIADAHDNYIYIYILDVCFMRLFYWYILHFIFWTPVYNFVLITIQEIFYRVLKITLVGQSFT